MLLEISKRLDIQHNVLDEEGRQLLSHSQTKPHDL
jgi:hypothetical protein